MNLLPIKGTSDIYSLALKHRYSNARIRKGDTMQVKV